MIHHQKLWITSFVSPRPCSETAYQTPLGKRTVGT